MVRSCEHYDILWVPQKEVNFLIIQTTIGLSRTFLHGDGQYVIKTWKTCGRYVSKQSTFIHLLQPAWSHFEWSTRPYKSVRLRILQYQLNIRDTLLSARIKQSYLNSRYTAFTLTNSLIQNSYIQPFSGNSPVMNHQWLWTEERGSRTPTDIQPLAKLRATITPNISLFQSHTNHNNGSDKSLGTSVTYRKLKYRKTQNYIYH